MKKGTFFLCMKEKRGELAARQVCGYIVELAGFRFGLHQNARGCEYHITEIETGFSFDALARLFRGGAAPRRLCDAVAVITPDFCAKVAEALTEDRFQPILEKARATIAGANAAHAQQPAEKKAQRAIKTRTARNLLRVVRLIMAKGYTQETAEELARKIFDEYEQNPAGLSILSRVDMVMNAEDYAKEYPADLTRPETSPARAESSPARIDGEQTPAEDAETTPAPVENSPALAEKVPATGQKIRRAARAKISPPVRTAKRRKKGGGIFSDICGAGCVLTAPRGREPPATGKRQIPHG
jgi:hypothetical protein